MKKEEIVCPAFTAASYLKYCLKFTGKVYLVGSKGMADELDLMDIQYVGEGPDPATSLDIDEWKALSIDKEVKAVLVGFDEHFSYIKLIKASTYLSDPGCVFIATNQDEKFPVTGDIVIPDVGVLVSAVGTAVQRQPVVVGKRANIFFKVL
ncbi:glycerol-3-phosphate phosphatase-like [Saccoglossus kowalevskii]